jgi:hypothetical protein
MTIIVKCEPPQDPPDGTIVAEARVWKGTVPSAGQRAFVWTSETSGGEGLALRGTVTMVECLDGTRTRLTIEPDGCAVHAAVGKADLLPFRMTNDGQPISRLAKKLYYQAHNKIIALSPEEVAFLDARFVPPAAQ